VNPLQARRFAEACGTRAKTDALDARMLARMGARLALAPEPPISAALQELRDLQQARTALVRDRLRLPQRQQAARLPLLKRLFARSLREADRQIAAIEAEIETRIAADSDLAERRRILVSVRGLGPCAAVAFIAGMPELGRLPARQAAALAGLAPMTRQSGRWCGPRRGSRAGGMACGRRSTCPP